MASPEHSAILLAFQKHGSGCTTCTRGSGAGEFTHVHGPRFPASGGRAPCECDHQIVVHENGAVLLRRGLEGPFALKRRPNVRIQIDDAGGGAGAPGKYGQFEYAETAANVLTRWTTYDWFAIDVVNALRARNLW